MFEKIAIKQVWVQIYPLVYVCLHFIRSCESSQPWSPYLSVQLSIIFQCLISILFYVDLVSKFFFSAGHFFGLVHKRCSVYYSPPSPMHGNLNNILKPFFFHHLHQFRNLSHLRRSHFQPQSKYPVLH